MYILVLIKFYSMIKKNTLLKSVFVIPVLFISLSVFTNSSNPPSANAGEPTGTNCTSCHSGTAITSGANWNAINISGLPAGGYVPGTLYTLTVSGGAAATSKNGFQVTCLTSSNANAGSMAAGTGTSTSSSGGRTYISHGSSTSGTWSFNWTAPASGTGTVTFYTCYNATNSNSGTGGDAVYTKTFALSQAVTNLPTAVITASSTTICVGDTLYLSGSGLNNPTGFSWVFLNSNPSSANTKDVKLVYTSAGNRQVRLTTSNADGNSLQASLTIQVIAKPTATITASALTICGNDSINLQANTGTGFTYLWTPGDFTTSSIYVKDSLSYKVKVTNASGCFATSSNLKPTKANYPQATFVNNKDTICNSDKVLFDITGNGFSAQYFVNDTSVQNSQNLLYEFSRSKAGIYKVAAQITAAGCATNLPAKFISIETQPNAPIVNCGNSTTSTIEFNWQPVSNYTNYEISLDTGNTWVNANGSNQLSHTINGLLPNTTKTIWVRVKSNGPCGNGLIASKTCINNGCNPINSFYNYKRFVCLSANEVVTTTPFEVKNISNPKYLIQYETDSITSTFSRNTIFNMPIKAGNNSIRIKIKDSVETGCPIIDSVFTIIGNLNPIVPNITSNKPNATYCKGQNIILTANRANSLNLISFYQLNPTRTLLQAGFSNAINLTNKLTLQNTLIKATVIDTATFCSDSSTVIAVTENPIPVANFSLEYFKSDSNNVNKNSVVFTNLTTDSSNYTWHFGDAANTTANTKNTSFVYTKGGVYLASLVAVNSFGCKDSVSKSVTITNTGVKTLSNQLGVKIYPNPANDFITIETNENSKNGAYYLLDINGKTIQHEAFNKFQTIDINSLPAGVYFIKLVIAEKIVYEKFVKN